MASPSIVGRELDGRYRITRQLGEGGMGMVYEGLQVALDRKVAIKVLHARLADDDRFRERFIREARSASRIRHPNVVQILDFGQTSDGLAYFVMEFLEGRDLRSLLNEVGRLPWRRTRWLLLQAVRALRAAHGKGIIHRDIKPGNCFLFDSPDEGTVDNVKLLDFGIAKLETDGHEGDPHAKSLTNTGEVFGTASYMAPEQARGQALDARSDVYSLGIMAYEMLVGTVPFTGTNPIHVITRHLTDPPRPLRELDPSIHPAVEALVLKAIAKEPEARFGSMAELEEALAAFPADVAVLPQLSTQVSPPPVVPLPPALEAGQAGSTGLTGRMTNPRPYAAPITEVLDLWKEPPPSVPLAPPIVISPVGGREDSGATSESTGVPAQTVLVPSQPIVVSADAASSSSHPQWATEASGAGLASQSTRPPPGEIDVATAPHQAARPAVAVTGPLPREPAIIADTHPHAVATVQRSERSPRAVWVFGVLALLGGGGVAAAVAWSDDDTESIVAPGAIDPKPAGPMSASIDPPSVEPAVPPPTQSPRDDVPSIANAKDGELPVEVPAAPEPDLEVDARPPSAVATPPPEAPQAAPAKTPPPSSTPPRKKTDGQVKSKLEQAILRACGSVGAGTRVTVELTVGSDGAILLKRIQAPGSVESCVTKQLSKAAFPAGAIRKLELDVQL